MTHSERFTPAVLHDSFDFWGKFPVTIHFVVLPVLNNISVNPQRIQRDKLEMKSSFQTLFFYLQKPSQKTQLVVFHFCNNELITTAPALQFSPVRFPEDPCGSSRGRMHKIKEVGQIDSELVLLFPTFLNAEGDTYHEVFRR
jgi:hypothetical protein